MEGVRVSLLAQAKQMTNANRLLERVRMKKKPFFPVVGRKELSCEFQRSREEPLKCKLLRVKYFRASMNTPPSRGTLIAHRFSSLSSLLCFLLLTSSLLQLAYDTDTVAVLCVYCCCDTTKFPLLGSLKIILFYSLNIGCVSRHKMTQESTIGINPL